MAFQAVADQPKNLERHVRKMCRDTFNEQGLLNRIVKDLNKLMSVVDAETRKILDKIDGEMPSNLWDGYASLAPGGKDWSKEGD